MSPFNTSSRRRRKGFTLLEIILAISIGVLLLAALYTAIDVQFRYTAAGRDVIQASAVARSVFERITSDLTPHLGPYNPSLAASSSSSSGGSGTPGQTASSPSSSSAASSSTASSSGSGASSTPGSSSTNSSSTNSGVVFNMGVQGDASTLSVYVSRWPKEIYQGSNDTTAQAQVSDLRRTTYWLVGGSDAAGGLARQEWTLATSDDVLNSSGPPNPDDPAFIMAPEVKSVQFQYFDGANQSWVDSWDGTAVTSDGKTPQGPPALIAVTLEIALPRNGKTSETKTFRHVVALPTANGPLATSSSATTSSNSGGGTSP